MEKSGYRLDRLSGFGDFYFKPCKPRSVAYMLTFFYGKGEISMWSMEQMLKENGGSRINGNLRSFGFASKAVFRVTKDIDLSQKKENRNILLMGALIKSIVFEMILCIMFAIPVVLQIIFDKSKIFSSVYHSLCFLFIYI